MLMRDVSLKQRILCIIRISILGAFSGEKSAHHTWVNTVHAHLSLQLKSNEKETQKVSGPTMTSAKHKQVKEEGKHTHKPLSPK